MTTLLDDKGTVQDRSKLLLQKVSTTIKNDRTDDAKSFGKTGKGSGRFLRGQRDCVVVFGTITKLDATRDLMFSRLASREAM